MEYQFTDNDISGFVKGLVEIGDIYKVDESPDKYIRNTSDEQIVTIPVDGIAKPLAIYGTAASDCVIVNPFVEGEADSNRNKWFYLSKNTNLSGHLIVIMNKLLEIGAESKKKKTPDAEPNLLLVGLLENVVGDIDEKMIKEFKSITSDPSTFFNIFWNKSLQQCEVKCSLFVTAQRKAFGNNIRVKTWEVLETLMSKVLQTSDLGEFTRKPTTIGIPYFETFVGILLEIYSRINEILKIMHIEIKNLEILKSHLKYAGLYYSRAKWCVSPQPGTTTSMPNNAMPSLTSPAPWGMNTMPASMPMPMPNTMMPQGGFMGGQPSLVVNQFVPGMPNMMNNMPSLLPGMPSMPSSAQTQEIPVRSGNPYIRS